MQLVRKLTMVAAVHNVNHRAAGIQCPMHCLQRTHGIVDVFQDSAGEDKVITLVRTENVLGPAADSP